MIKALLLPGMMMICVATYGQVRWTFSAQKKNDTVMELHCRAVLAEGWHLYGTDTLAAPFPTRIDIVPAPKLMTKGLPREQGDRAADDGVVYYTGSVEFVQTVGVNKETHTVRGSVEYVICTKEQCMPPAKKDWVVRW